ncbi:DUF4369 domain-containing protein [Mucilaginibacter psychrotolerans]|uniref:DUF4369 domain-containing protein n=1 Tax=Mucilaginibacter psychrotolerans TaxID=1524096 RepID=A0A4Y8SJ96_9SPHI|nr:DUF4369 domain-containing protein [Mucilaginibacter psychrotolerans]TFF38771.1 DUF4369 domain-containing protein [Mucilaginibacter psychrotolerans]
MKLHTTICTALLLASHFCLAQTYKLKGNVKGLSVDSLLILKFKGDKVEGAKVKVSKQKFYYEDAITEPYFIQILKLKNGSTETTGKLADILVEPGTIQITGTADQYDSIKVKGSTADLVLKNYLQEDKALLARWDKLKESYDVYVANGDTASRKKVGKELNAITLKERVPLLKAYVAKYRRQIVGALIPNFCTLKEVLKKEDYLEMYNSLSPKMQQTGYGQSVFNNSK